jgi:hypothetical protein
MMKEGRTETMELEEPLFVSGSRGEEEEKPWMARVREKKGEWQ